MILAAPLKQSFDAVMHTKWISEDGRYGNSTVDGGACVVGSHSRVFLVINIYRDVVVCLPLTGAVRSKRMSSGPMMMRMIGTAHTIRSPLGVADWLATGHALLSSAARHHIACPPGCIIVLSRIQRCNTGSIQCPAHRLIGRCRPSLRLGGIESVKWLIMDDA